MRFGTSAARGQTVATEPTRVDGSALRSRAAPADAAKLQPRLTSPSGPKGDRAGNLAVLGRGQSYRPRVAHTPP
jgi:hypothetical protein